MNVDQFVAKYNGVHIDEDGYYGAQCWDVSARYAREVVGCPSFPTGSGGAEGLFSQFKAPIPQYFDRIANNKSDPNQLPVKGDVIVWDGSFSPPWGHTAVCISADQSGVTVLEQNGNNPGGVAYIKKRGWTAVSGWLRPKGGAMAEKMIDGDDIGLLRIGHSEIGGWPLHETHAGKFDDKFLGSWRGKPVRAFIWAQWNAGAAFRGLREKWRVFYETNQTIGQQLTQANTTIAGLTDQIKELGKRPTQDQLDALAKTAQEANNKAVAAQAELEKLIAERTEANKVGNAFLRWIGDLLSKIKPGA